MRVYQFILIGFLAVILVACGGDSAPPAPTLEPTISPTERPTITPMPTPLPRPRTAAVNIREQSYARLIHASTNLDSVDVYVDGLAIGFRLGFAGMTEPIAIVAGEYTLRVMEAGVSPNQGTSPIHTQMLNLPAGTTVSLVLTGTPDNLRVAVLPENISPLAGDTGRITLIHALHNGGTISLQQNGETITTGIEINQASIPVDLASLDTNISIIDASGRSLADYTDILRPRTAVTLVLTGDADRPDSIRLLEFSSRVPGIARLRALNLIPDALRVDIYLDGEPVVNNADYGRITDRQELLPGTYRVDILPADADYASTPPLNRTEISFTEDQNTTLILTGTASDVIGITRLRDDTSPTTPDETRLTFVHGWQGIGSAQAFLGSSANSDRLEYREVSQSLFLSPGTYDVAWRTTNQASDIAIAEGLELEAGFSYIYILTPPTEDEQQLPFIIIEAVGVTEATQTTTQAVPSPTPLPRDDDRAQVHVVNALTSRELINVVVGDEVITNAAYGQMSSAVMLDEGLSRIRAQDANTTSDFSQLEFDFRRDTHYTVYVAGTDIDTARIFVIENGLINRITDPTLGTLRLLNLSLVGGTSFNLAVIASDSAPPEPPQDATRDANLPPFRRVVTGGYDVLSRDVRSGQAGFTEFVAPDVYNIIIVDAQNGYGAGTQNNVSIQAQRRYDVVIVQAESGEVMVLIVEYPTD